MDAMQSIKAQDADRELFELVIVNNNSTDSTDALCAQFAQTLGSLNYTYVIEPKAGLSNARNCGIAAAKGKIITFIDDDAIAEKDFVRNIIGYFERNPQVDAIGGKVIPIFPGGKEPEWLIPPQNGLVTKVDLGNTAKVYSNKYPAGCNMTFKKAVFEELGGFNPDLVWRNDDKFIFLKLSKARKVTHYVPNVVVHHNIDAYRLEKQYLDKLIHFIGSSERIRLKGQTVELIKKPLEYTAKLLAALLIAMRYFVVGERVKATYLIYVRWKVLTSFFQKPVKY